MEKGSNRFQQPTSIVKINFLIHLFRNMMLAITLEIRSLF